MKYDELITYTIDDTKYNEKLRVDEAIAELKCELRDALDDAKSSREMITELHQKLHDIDNQWNEQCKEIAELKAENERLKSKLENVQATAYADSVDAGMLERRLRRALYKACANWADMEVFERTVGIDDPNVEANRWALMRNKCLKKAEEYK